MGDEAAKVRGGAKYCMRRNENFVVHIAFVREGRTIGIGVGALK